jgi:hypothetical protein
VESGMLGAVDATLWLMKDPNHALPLPELVQQFAYAKFIFITYIIGHRVLLATIAKLSVRFASVQHIPGVPGTTYKEWAQGTVRRMDHYRRGIVDFTKANKPEPPIWTGWRSAD